ncbi:hypothetical protein PVAP13_7KG093736, partial [Panicum virgatum]
PILFGIVPDKLLLPRFSSINHGVLLNKSNGSRTWRLVRFPIVEGMEPDRLLSRRPRYLSLRSLPRLRGMEPVRPVFARSRTKRKERL